MIFFRVEDDTGRKPAKACHLHQRRSAETIQSGCDVIGNYTSIASPIFRHALFGRFSKPPRLRMHRAWPSLKRQIADLPKSFSARTSTCLERHASKNCSEKRGHEMKVSRPRDLFSLHGCLEPVDPNRLRKHTKLIQFFL
jgi:hypothetical protein